MKQINIFQIIWGILTRKEIYCFIVRYVVQDGMLDNTFHHQYVTHNKKYLDWDNIAKVFSKIAEAHKDYSIKITGIDYMGYIDQEDWEEQKCNEK